MRLKSQSLLYRHVSLYLLYRLVDCHHIMVCTGLMHRWLLALTSIQSFTVKPEVKTQFACAIDFKVIFYLIKASWLGGTCFDGKPLVTYGNAFGAGRWFCTCITSARSAPPERCEATVSDVIHSSGRLAQAPADWWVCNLRLSRSTTCHSTPINHSDSHRSWAQFCEGENTAHVGQREENSYSRFAVMSNVKLDVDHLVIGNLVDKWKTESPLKLYCSS